MLELDDEDSLNLDFMDDGQGDLMPSEKDFESLDVMNEEEINQAVATILTDSIENIQPTFYRDLDPTEEFGVSRFVADRVYYLPQLLDNISLTHIQDTNYLLSAESKSPNGNIIKLEHRFKATTEEEAEKLYKKIHTQLAGIELKIWLSCWRLGDELRRYTYSCLLTDLMKIVYPSRKGYFSVSDKTEFYEHLKSLEQTKFIFSKPKIRESRKKVKKDVYQTFEIPLLQIISRLGGEEDKYPQQLTISIMNLFPHPGKMAFVGAAFKHKTLELHADDTQLATWIQTRKSQRPEESHIVVDRAFLIRLARLQKTDATNPTIANKNLVLKLKRLVNTGILIEAPCKITYKTKEIKLRIK